MICERIKISCESWAYILEIILLKYLIHWVGGDPDILMEQGIGIS